MSGIDPKVRQELADLVLQYSTAIDTRDWDMFRAIWTDDCATDYGKVGSWNSAEAITDFMEEIHAPCGRTMHTLGNQVIETTGDGYSSRTYVDAIVMNGDNRSGLRMAGWYDDDFVATGDGWKIARRVFTLVVANKVGRAEPE
jgi:3-phenylpropionate/cinnamic acid dioxygenase small subunit